jgi:hypothetical protein
MLIIRKAQMKVFEEQSRKRFENLMAEHLAEEYPEKVEEMGEEGTKKLIARGIDDAGRYGIDAERDVARYIELMVEIEPAWPNTRRMAWADGLLKDAQLTGHAKMELISQRITEFSQ